MSEPTTSGPKATRSISPHFVAEVEVELGAVDSVRQSSRKRNLWFDAWRDLRTRPTFYISAVLIVLVALAALLPHIFTQVNPTYCDLVKSNDDPTGGHPLGFDKQGCDVYSRVINGASLSLSVGLIVTILVAVMGIVFGAIGGFFGGWVDSVLSRIGDIFFSIPYILAAVVIMSIFSQYRNVWTVSLAIGLFSWPATARILRSEILRVKQSDFVVASQAIGVSRFRILVSHVLPNAIAPVIVVTTVQLAAAITAEATLSYLGVGLGSAVSWGHDISQAQTSLRTSPRTLLWPSVALSLTVLSFIMLGEAVREALDPKSRAR